MSNFWDNMWLIVSTFVCIAYLLLLFHVGTDLFRDSSIGGGAKILWLIFLIFLPMMTVLAYILFRGDGMAQRQKAAMASAKSDTDAYIRHVAGKSPGEQIADAKALLDAGTVTQAEYEQLKAKALA